ncbi:MAG: M15 family metallopeptidase [Minisyncoccia bacterium]
MDPHPTDKVKVTLGVFVLLLTLGLGYLGYQYSLLHTAKIAVETDLRETEEAYASTSKKLLGDIDAMRDLLLATQGEKVSAEQDIRNQQDALNAMSNTLGLYQKLATTDKELLAKYSKVYFLNENYTPRKSTVIPLSYTAQPEIEKMISADVWPFLQKMLDDAYATSTDVKIISAFRSFDTQSSLKSIYKVTYGTGANKFSADQGYSEHQLGTTIDFTTTKLGTKYETFEKTPAYAWLTENAYRYGFVLSYPKNNAYYIFEPWHWRFVGKALALRLHDEHKNFVDLPQRDIDEYLLTLFEQ